MKQESLEIVGVLRRDVPAAGAVAGDRVIFRPGHADPTRECVVMHSAQASAFLSAIESGGIEIIGVRPDGFWASARWMLLNLLRHPRRRLALVR